MPSVYVKLDDLIWPGELHRVNGWRYQRQGGFVPSIAGHECQLMDAAMWFRYTCSTKEKNPPYRLPRVTRWKVLFRDPKMSFLDD